MISCETSKGLGASLWRYLPVLSFLNQTIAVRARIPDSGGMRRSLRKTIWSESREMKGVIPNIFLGEEFRTVRRKIDSNRRKK